MIPPKLDVEAGHFTADAMTEASVSAIGLFVCGKGFRVVISRELWDGGAFPGAWGEISVLELIAYALLTACASALSAGHRTGLVIAESTDNSTVLHRVHRGYARGKGAAHANSILRVALRMTTHARLTPVLSWLKSEDNGLSDAPSRGDQLAFGQHLSSYWSNFPDRTPEWWPRDLPIKPPGREFATCNAGSALYAFVHHLGRSDGGYLQFNGAQMDLLLRNIREELVGT